MAAPDGGVTRSDGIASGRVALVVGLVAVAVSGYAFLGLTGREFGPAGAAPLAMLWAVANAVGAGLFVPVEQELARRVAARQAVGQDSAPVVRSLAGLSAGLVGLLAVVAAIFARPLADGLFGGHTGLVAALVLACAGFAAQHVTRGVLAGHGRFGRYGVQLGVDGTLRVAGPAALAAADVGSVVAYGIVLAIAPILSVTLTGGARSTEATAPGPVEPPREVAGALAMVLVGQVLSTAVIGAGPVAAALLAGPDEAVVAGVLIGVLLVARAPLLGFYAVQATLLPRLARLVAVADLAGLRRQLTRSTGAVAAIGVVCTVGALAAGPPAIRLVLGPGFHTTAAITALLVAATFVYIAAAVTAQSLLAVRGHLWSALAWVGGAGTYALLLARPAELPWRVGVAFLGSGLVALALAAVPLVLVVRRPAGRGQRGDGPPQWNERSGDRDMAGQLVSRDGTGPR
jgi:O-antigen/teichoic acid export membrane protein